jgi:hypothetical protein
MSRRQRGSTAERGYGTHHQQLRASLAPLVATGTVDCWRCGRRIEPTERWDLGHDDEDRRVYRGPEHIACNRGSAAVRGNRQRASRRNSRDWLT